MSDRTFVGIKDPGATLDYQIDWSQWLGSDTLSNATWTVPAGLTKVSENYTSTLATVWVSGGTAGTTYTLVCHVVTAGGRVEERSLLLVCRER